jgi:tyrosyl-tRNA synthetase
MCVPDDEEITVKISNTKSPPHNGKKHPQPVSPSKQGGGGTTSSSSAAAGAAAIQEDRAWTKELQEDYDRIFSVGEECISGPELKQLLLLKGRGSDSDVPFHLYDGFEPSGRMHIAQGVFKAMNVNKCTATPGTNAKFIFWVADWFALMNDKMGGDLEKIKVVGEYLQQVWKAAGMDLTHVEFKWASTEITTRAASYWPIMLNVASRFNITRIKKCCQIMGRLEGSLTAAQVLYPLMQCTDVFFLKADICQLGVDQRKVNMLAREYCDAARIRHKPIILSHHMLYGLKAGQEKMSKSDPDSAIFMEDSAEDVERKILGAYCPSAEEAAAEAAAKEATKHEDDGEGGEEEDAGKASMRLSNEDTLKNPCLDYIQYIIFSPPGATFTTGNGQVFTNFQDVRTAFVDGSLSKDDLKRGLIVALNALLEPVRLHFTNNEHAKNLLALVQQYKKEDYATATTAAALRRLNLVALKKAPASSHLVFCPLPTANPTLQEALDVLSQLASATKNSRGSCVLFLSDWTARVCNACDADGKVIASFYTVFLSALRALNPSLMEKVHVVTQSEAILADPSNYWISVINVGRQYSLDEVMGSDMKDSDGVGAVIGRLMRVADVAGVEPSSVAISPCDALQGQLVADFFRDKLPGLSIPTIITTEAANTRLQPVRESAALETENDQFFLLDDPKVCVCLCVCLCHKEQKIFCSTLSDRLPCFRNINHNRFMANQS